MKRVLAISGSDSCSGAGIQADLKTFAAMRVYGLSAITAVTAQNTVAVTGIHNIPHEFVGKQISTVLEDIEIHAVKVGMLANTGIIQTVAEILQSYNVPNLVVDPVMVATSGDLLMDERIDKILWAFRNVLIPTAHVITPNIPETEILTGNEINSVDDMKTAAVTLQSLGVPYVVITGGHLDNMDEAVDILFDGNTFIEFRNKRIPTKNTHGTGCTFAAALAASLANGYTIREAVGKAKKFVLSALEYSFSIGRGKGPTNHFGNLYHLADSCTEKEQK
jgi:hydroxymethylpyrimidine/phosphomethylpyrimidine kinase